MATIERVDWRAAHSDRGAALVAVLLLTVLLSALGAAGALMADVESTIAANHHDGIVVGHAADGAMAFAIQELALLEDWTPVLAGVSSRLVGAFRLPLAAGGLLVDVPGMTTALQQTTHGGSGLGPNTPQWRPFGHGVPGVDLPFGGLSKEVYVLTWASDDVAETDGDPFVDGNGVVVLRARAMGARRSQSDIQAVVARVAPGVVRRVSWRVMR